MISWRVVNSSSSLLVVEILQRYAWRYNRFAPYCDDATILKGLPLLGDSTSYLNCITNCSANLTRRGSVQVPCTGYNIAEQYAMGEGRFTIKVPQNFSFIATFSSSAWFDLVTGKGLAWSVAVQIQTFKRTDIKRYNNAPIVTMLPIYRLRNRVSYSIKINVADNDFDPYICRWSQGTRECGGLNNSIPDGIIDNYRCYLNFTPQKEGFYAAALTIQDFMILKKNISASNYLSQVPIQFIFRVYESSHPCVTGPIYVGDLAPDACIHMSVNATYRTRIRFKIQCTNATVTSIISVNPTGLLTSPIQQDPFDPTTFVFLISFTSSTEHVGQNLFCFAAVDSIGNQGDSTCLRFTVSSQTSSLQPLYITNATRYPMGTVSKTTSIWTILTDSRFYQRPTTETYIRFKRVSDNVDYYVLNAVTATKNILYLSDRILINSSIVWRPGEYFYIYFDPGVLVEANTCSKEAMPITDPKFWSFNTPSERATTPTSFTTTTSTLSTTKKRTIPTHRTFVTSTKTTSTASTRTTTISTMAKTVTSETTSISTSTLRSKSTLSISAIVGISLASLLLSSLLTYISMSLMRIVSKHFPLQKSDLQQQLISSKSSSTGISTDLGSNTVPISMTTQYKLPTRSRQQEHVSKYSICNNAQLVRDSLSEVQV